MVKLVKGMIDSGSDWNAMGRRQMTVLKLTMQNLQVPTDEKNKTTTASGHRLKSHEFVDANVHGTVNQRKIESYF